MNPINRFVQQSPRTSQNDLITTAVRPPALPEQVLIWNADLGAQTVSTLTQVRQAQSILVQAIDKEPTKAAGGASAASDLEKPQYEAPSQTSTVVTGLETMAKAAKVTDVNPAKEADAAIDCATAPGTILRTISVPFALSSKAMPAAQAGALGLSVNDLNNCDTARLMINGHSDGTAKSWPIFS